MATWGQPTELRYTAWNSDTNAGVAGDGANHSLTLRRDGVDSAYVGSPTDLGNGRYSIAISGTLMEAGTVSAYGTSSTVDVRLWFEHSIRTVKPAPTLTEISNQITSDHGSGTYTDSGTDVNIVSVAGNSVTSTDDFKADVSSIPTETLTTAQNNHLMALANTDLSGVLSAIGAIPTDTLASDERSHLMSLVNTDLTSTNNAIAQIPTDNDVNIVSVNGVSVVSVDDFKATTVIASNMVSPAPSVSDIQQAAEDALTAYDAAKGADSMNLSSTAIQAVRNDLERSGGVLESISTNQIDTTDVEGATTSALTAYGVAKVSDIPSGSSNDPPVVAIDTSGSPWEMVYYDPSDGVSEIARRSLYTVDGIPITSTNQIVGQQMKA